MNTGNPSLDAQTDNQPLASQIRQSLYDDILAGQLKPGTRLDEVSLAARFGVSRTPVREALREMVSTGLAEHRHRRGVFVSQVPDHQLADMFVFAAELEAVCARLAAQNMTSAEREQLMALHLESHSAVRRGDVDAYDQANIGFHDALFRGAHNTYLHEATVEARQRVAPFRRAQFQVGDRLATSYDEHNEIILALMRGDGEKASQLVRRHVLHSESTEREFLAERKG